MQFDNAPVYGRLFCFLDVCRFPLNKINLLDCKGGKEVYVGTG